MHPGQADPFDGREIEMACGLGRGRMGTYLTLGCKQGDRRAESGR